MRIQLLWSINSFEWLSCRYSKASKQKTSFCKDFVYHLSAAVLLSKKEKALPRIRDIADSNDVGERVGMFEGKL